MLKDVTFYQYCHDSLERTVCKLLEKVYTTGKHSIVLLDGSERVSLLDNMIWTYATMSFLPHGSNLDDKDMWKIQPIWLTDKLENPNDAKILMVTQGEKIEKNSGFERCLDLIAEDETESAIKRKNHYKKLGCNVVCWKQNLKGTWEKSE